MDEEKGAGRCAECSGERLLDNNNDREQRSGIEPSEAVVLWRYACLRGLVEALNQGEASSAEGRTRSELEQDFSLGVGFQAATFPKEIFRSFDLEFRAMRLFDELKVTYSDTQQRRQAVFERCKGKEKEGPIENDVTKKGVTRLGKSMIDLDRKHGTWWHWIKTFFFHDREFISKCFKPIKTERFREQLDADAERLQLAGTTVGEDSFYSITYFTNQKLHAKRAIWVMGYLSYVPALLFIGCMGLSFALLSYVALYGVMMAVLPAVPFAQFIVAFHFCAASGFVNVLLPYDEMLETARNLAKPLKFFKPFGLEAFIFLGLMLLFGVGLWSFMNVVLPTHSLPLIFGSIWLLAALALPFFYRLFWQKDSLVGLVSALILPCLAIATLSAAFFFGFQIYTAVAVLLLSLAYAQGIAMGIAAILGLGTGIATFAIVLCSFRDIFKALKDRIIDLVKHWEWRRFLNLCGLVKENYNEDGSSYSFSEMIGRLLGVVVAVVAAIKFFFDCPLVLCMWNACLGVFSLPFAVLGLIGWLCVVMPRCMKGCGAFMQLITDVGAIRYQMNQMRAEPLKYAIGAGSFLLILSMPFLLSYALPIGISVLSFILFGVGTTLAFWALLFLWGCVFFGGSAREYPFFSKGFFERAFSPDNRNRILFVFFLTCLILTNNLGFAVSTLMGIDFYAGVKIAIELFSLVCVCVHSFCLNYYGRKTKALRHSVVKETAVVRGEVTNETVDQFIEAKPRLVFCYVDVQSNEEKHLIFSPKKGENVNVNMNDLP